MKAEGGEVSEGSRLSGMREPRWLPLIRQWDAHVVLFYPLLMIPILSGAVIQMFTSQNSTWATPAFKWLCVFQSVYHSKRDSLKQSYDSKQTTTSIVISWWITVKPNRLVNRRGTSWSMLLIVRLFLIKNQTDPSGKINWMQASAVASLEAHQITIDFEGSITASGITESSCSTTNNTFWEARRKMELCV